MSAKIAYTYEEAAVQVGKSLSTIKRQVALGNLTPRYADSKPIILHDDLVDWARTLPVDRP